MFKDRGFGFIKTGDGKDIFFHMRALQNIGFELLKEGDSVKFNIVKGLKGPKAPKAVNIEVKEKKE